MNFRMSWNPATAFDRVFAFSFIQHGIFLGYTAATVIYSYIDHHWQIVCVPCVFIIIVVIRYVR